MSPITVIKRNLQGKETWRYTGRELKRDKTSVQLEAHFSRPDIPFHGILLGKGDRFVETFYTDKWYNIFEIHDRDDDRLKGWYCNIGEPAVIKRDTVSYIDLALDLLVYPDGRQLVLDEDEFNALSLSPKVQAKAISALDSLQAIFNEKITGQV
jgi:predicted RNA-binding protein associated with RNAse of E/G family